MLEDFTKDDHPKLIAELISKVSKNTECIHKNHEKVESVCVKLEEVQANLVEVKLLLTIQTELEGSRQIALEEMQQQFNTVEAKLKGLMDLLDDLASLGRLSSKAAKVFKWFAGFGGVLLVLVGIYEWLSHTAKSFFGGPP